MSSSLCSGSSHSSCSSASSSSASSFTTSSCVHSFVPSILFPAGGAVDLCLWAQQTWRLSSSCVGCFLELGCTRVHSQLALLEATRPRRSESWPPPGGPYQYWAVHQYFVVRRVWGASGVAGFLIFAPPTPPQDLIAGILSTHVRCISIFTNQIPNSFCYVGN